MQCMMFVHVFLLNTYLFYVYFPSGHYLYFRGRPNMEKARAMVTSPWFSRSERGCSLNMSVHMGNMKDGWYEILVETKNVTWGVISAQPGDDLNR